MRYWIDTEHHDDGTHTELISLAVVAEDGRELCLISSEYERGRATAWLAEHVVPFLPSASDTACRSLAAIRDELRVFVGDDPKPEFWSVCATCDWPLVVRLFGTLDDLPRNWPLTCWDLWQWAMHLDVVELPAHHGRMHTALDDARWHRRVHEFLRETERHRARPSNVNDQAAQALGAASVILDQAERVLLVKHSYGHHNWEIPGGLSEAGESAEETALREAREELGVEILLERLTGVYWEPGWRDRGGHHFVFLARLRDGAIPRAADPNEIAEVRWSSPEDLPRPISDFTVLRIKDALDGGAARIRTIRSRTWLE